MGDLSIHMQIDRQNEKISFKPLHDGVGFHPFSEGLPYAPQTKTEYKIHPTAPSTTPNYTRGAGAMSAGKPSFSMPLTTRQIQQQNTQNAVQKPVVQIRTVSPVATPTVSTPSLIRRRFFAYLLDTVFHLGFWISTNLIATLGFHFELDGPLFEKNWMGFVAFFIFSQWFFISMQEVLFENSIGKVFFGLEFKRSNSSFFGSSLLLRSIVFMIGLLPAGLGLYFLPQDKIAEIQLKHT